jgi:hypothetical protein
MIIGKQKMKTVVSILASDGHGWTECVQACRDTWANNPPKNTEVFYNYGDAFLEKHNMNIPEGSCALGEDIIACNAPEQYGFLLLKTILAFETLLSLEDFDYIVRPNCGSYIHLGLLNKYLESQPREKFYGGELGEWNGIEYVSGACMIFSRDVAELLVTNKKDLHYDGTGGKMDDVAIGEFLATQSIKPIKFGKRVICVEDDIEEKFDADAQHHYFSSSRNPKCHYKTHELFNGVTA